MKITTHYDNLQVARNASTEVIRAAYRSLTQRHHPDRNPADPARCERIMKILNRAYEVLSDPKERRKHDAWIAEQEAAARVESLTGTGASGPTSAIDGSTILRPASASTASYAAASAAFRTSRTSSTGPVQGGDASADEQPHDSHRTPNARASVDRMAEAVAAYRAERTGRAATAQEAGGRTTDQPRDYYRASATPPSAALDSANRAFGATGEHSGGSRNGGQKAATPTETETTAPNPAGLLFALITWLKYSGMLTGIVLYGKLSSVSDSIRPEFAHDWKTTEVQLWLVWAIAVVAYYAAGHLLASQNARSTRSQAIGLLWVGALLAPLFGLLIAPMALPHQLATNMPTYYVPIAIRGVLFATACTLYLSLSRRVRRTYPAATSAVRATRGNSTPADSVELKHAKKEAAGTAREYAANAGWWALATGILLSNQAHPGARTGLFPAWFDPWIDIVAWVTGITCVGFALAALATKWRSLRL